MNIPLSLTRKLASDNTSADMADTAGQYCITAY